MAHLTPSNQLLPILRATPNLQHLVFDCEITQSWGGLSEELFDDDVILDRLVSYAAKFRIPSQVTPDEDEFFDPAISIININGHQKFVKLEP